MISIEPMPVAERVEAFRGLGAVNDVLDEIDASADRDDRSVLALSREVLPAADAVEGIVRQGRRVVLGHLTLDELHEFEPIQAVRLPPASAYQLLDVDLGASSRNVAPEAALRDILQRGRSPLTLEEGIAVMLQQPEAIAKGWGYSMAGSRREDQRVTAFWVSEGRPKLGWCWDRNPHTWLGTASCSGRMPV